MYLRPHLIYNDLVVQCWNCFSLKRHKSSILFLMNPNKHDEQNRFIRPWEVDDEQNRSHNIPKHLSPLLVMSVMIFSIGCGIKSISISCTFSYLKLWVIFCVFIYKKWCDVYSSVHIFATVQLNSSQYGTKQILLDSVHQLVLSTTAVWLVYRFLRIKLAATKCCNCLQWKRLSRDWRRREITCLKMQTTATTWPWSSYLQLWGGLTGWNIAVSYKPVR